MPELMSGVGRLDEHVDHILEAAPPGRTLVADAARRCLPAAAAGRSTTTSAHSPRSTSDRFDQIEQVLHHVGGGTDRRLVHVEQPVGQAMTGRPPLRGTQQFRSRHVSRTAGDRRRRGRSRPAPRTMAAMVTASSTVAEHIGGAELERVVAGRRPKVPVQPGRLVDGLGCRSCPRPARRTRPGSRSAPGMPAVGQRPNSSVR